MSQLTILSPAEQVMAHLRGELFQGRWQGTIPGAPTLAAELGVDHKTVAGAIRLLEHEGLLVNQGVGRARRIELPKDISPPTMRVALLVHDTANQDFVIELRHLLDKAGHTPFFPTKTLQELDMNVRRLDRLVKQTEADAWVVFSGSREVLEWFAQQDTPAFALVGRRDGLPIAGTGPNKAPAFAQVIREFITLGHRRISTICRRHIRLPQPSETVRTILDELEAAGITTGAFHLPDWQEDREGIEAVLDSLFSTTPPTAMILDEPHLYYATYHFLATRGFRVPQDVSLVCTDPDYSFGWCNPSVAHIKWDYRPVMRRVIGWANNVAHGKDDRRQTSTKAEFVTGGTVGPAPRG